VRQSVKLRAQLSGPALAATAQVSDVDASHDTDIKLQICENADSESVCNESHV
jgi:hypothetical protein